jgi:hypothetical protein
MMLASLIFELQYPVLQISYCTKMAYNTYLGMCILVSCLKRFPIFQNRETRKCRSRGRNSNTNRKPRSTRIIKMYQSESRRSSNLAETRRIADHAASRRILDETETRRTAEQAESRRITDQTETRKTAMQADSRKVADQAETRRIAEHTESRRTADQAETQRTADETETRRTAYQLGAMGTDH